MTLRVPKERLEDARALTGQMLDIKGSQVQVGKSSVKPLSALPTLFARYVAASEDQEEPDFMDYLFSEFSKLDIKARKILCGKPSSFSTPEGQVFTRSVMVADLEPEQAVRLQEKGVGEFRKMGCGLFLPHKGIKAVGDMSEKQHFTGN
jgi:CRISPR-associated protein Cas6